MQKILSDRPRVGSLFSGYGGLDLGLDMLFGGLDLAWVCEFDANPSRILRHNHPDVPNLHDVTTVDWDAVAADLGPIDILTGGFPCQDVSLAGMRRGLKPGTRSGLWTHMAYAIDRLRPGMVVIENVLGLLSADAHSSVEPCGWCVGDGSGEPALRALGAVLGSLAELGGYEARWGVVRASDAGAPHQRARVFVIATTDDGLARFRDARLAPAGTPAMTGGTGGTMLPTPAATFIDSTWNPGYGTSLHTAVTTTFETAGSEWGEYQPVIDGWATVVGRPAPNPVQPHSTNLMPIVVTTEFVEWLMGLPQGHLTHPGIGLGRRTQLKALGNGVVPQQAALAVRLLLDIA